MARMFLMMDGVTITSLEDLKEQFNPKQITGYYKSKRLHAWLRQRGFTDEAAKLDALGDLPDDDEIILSLMEVFDLNDDQVAKIEKRIAAEKAEVEKQMAEATANVPETISDDADLELLESTSTSGEKWMLCTLPNLESELGELEEPNGYQMSSKAEPVGDVYSCRFSQDVQDIEIGVFKNNFWLMGKISDENSEYGSDAERYVLCKSADGITWKYFDTVKSANFDGHLHMYCGKKHLIFYHESLYDSGKETVDELGYFDKNDLSSISSHPTYYMRGEDGSSSKLSSICEGNNGLLVEFRVKSYTKHFVGTDHYLDYIALHFSDVDKNASWRNVNDKGEKTCWGYFKNRIIATRCTISFDDNGCVEESRKDVPWSMIQNLYICPSAVFVLGDDADGNCTWWCSFDGKVWKTADLNIFDSVAIGESNGKFYAVGCGNGKNRTVMSDDGIVWNDWITLANSCSQWSIKCTNDFIMLYPDSEDGFGQYLICQTNSN